MIRPFVLVGLPVALCCLLGGTLLSGCSFILDFEELQSNESVRLPDGGLITPDDDVGDDDVSDDDADDDTGDDTGTPDGGSGDCPGSCDDGDACTTDVCRNGSCVNEPKTCSSSDPCAPAMCVDGACVPTPIEGIVADGFERITEADVYHNNALLGANDRFYSAAYGSFDGADDVVLSSFGAEGDSALAELRFSRVIVDAVVRSPVSFVGDESDLRFELNAYVAVQQPNDVLGEMLRLRFNSDLVLSVPDPSMPDDKPVVIATPGNYRALSDRWGPSALKTAAAEPFVVWAGSNNSGDGLFLQRGDAAAATDQAIVPTAAAVSGVEAITAGNRPGAVWMIDQQDGVTLQAIIQGGTPVPTTLQQCDQSPGYSGYSLDVDQSIADIWTVAWTKRSGDNFIAELTPLICSADSCVDPTPIGAGQACTQEQIDGRVFAGVSSLKTRTMRRQGDPDNVIYQAIMVGLQDNAEDQAALSLLFNRVEFDLDSDTSQEPTPLGAAALLDQTNLARAPREPSLSILAPDKIAVSWVRTKEDGTGDELVVQRHRICFGD